MLKYLIIVLLSISLVSCGQLIWLAVDGPDRTYSEDPTKAPYFMGTVQSRSVSGVRYEFRVGEMWYDFLSLKGGHHQIIFREKGSANNPGYANCNLEERSVYRLKLMNETADGKTAVCILVKRNVRH